MRGEFWMTIDSGEDDGCTDPPSDSTHRVLLGLGDHWPPELTCQGVRKAGIRPARLLAFATKSRLVPYQLAARVIAGPELALTAVRLNTAQSSLVDPRRRIASDYFAAWMALVFRKGLTPAGRGILPSRRIRQSCRGHSPRFSHP